MQLDPINWSLTVAKLRKWSPLVDVPVLTDSLFRERALPTHQPRSSSNNFMSQQMRLDRPGLYSFHRPLATPVDKKQLQRVNLPSSILSALVNINRHKFSLSALGILPNELRKLSRAEGYDPEPLLDALRRAFFWGSYKIWKKRKTLVKLHWESKKSTQQRRRKGVNCSNCKSPFHFLKKIADLSKQRLHALA